MYSHLSLLIRIQLSTNLHLQLRCKLAESRVLIWTSIVLLQSEGLDNFYALMEIELASNGLWRGAVLYMLFEHF